MGTKHFIGMAGLYSCLPSHCDVYDTPQEAAQALGDLYDLSARKIKRLARDRAIPMPFDAGVDYVEIQTCDCDTPAIHSDSTTPGKV